MIAFDTNLLVRTVVADALHLAVCGTSVMHTFDRRFCKAAREAGLTPEVRVLPNGV